MRYRANAVVFVIFMMSSIVLLSFSLRMTIVRNRRYEDLSLDYMNHKIEIESYQKNFVDKEMEKAFKETFFSYLDRVNEKITLERKKSKDINISDIKLDNVEILSNADRIKIKNLFTSSKSPFESSNFIVEIEKNNLNNKTNPFLNINILGVGNNYTVAILYLFKRPDFTDDELNFIYSKEEIWEKRKSDFIKRKYLNV